MVFRGFYEAARNLDSQPPPRADHVEASRPRGLCSTLDYSPGNGPKSPDRAPVALAPAPKKLLRPPEDPQHAARINYAHGRQLDAYALLSARGRAAGQSDS